MIKIVNKDKYELLQLKLDEANEALANSISAYDTIEEEYNDLANKYLEKSNLVEELNVIIDKLNRKITILEDNAELLKADIKTSEREKNKILAQLNELTKISIPDEEDVFDEQIQMLQEC